MEDQPGQDTQAAIDRRYRLSSVLLVLYMIVLSLWGFDLLMSLDPRWYSGLFGGYYVVTSMYPGFGLVTYLTIRSNERGLTHVAPPAIQDVAKLTFALAVFWMYFFFSQYLVIWYGNVPVETRYLARRFFNQPWGGIAWAIFIIGWLIPFSYLLKRLTGRPPTRRRRSHGRPRTAGRSRRRRWPASASPWCPGSAAGTSAPSDRDRPSGWPAICA